MWVCWQGKEVSEVGISAAFVMVCFTRVVSSTIMDQTQIIFLFPCPRRKERFAECKKHGILK